MTTPSSTETTETVTPDALWRIEELCEAMDREDMHAHSPFGGDSGRTILEECRFRWMERARTGLPLPQRWCRDEDEAMLEERFRIYGTREWRKARPAWLESLPELLRETPGYGRREPEHGPAR